MENKSTFQKVIDWFKPLSETQNGPSDVRATSELPILGSPNQPINAVNLTNTSTAVSTDRALSLAGVYRAVNILSTATAQLELGVWRNGEELELPNTHMVVQPDINESLSSFLEQTVNSLAINGNAYWLLNKSGPTADVKNITVLNPAQVRIEYENGKKYFREGDKRYPAWKVKHLMHSRLPGYEYGVGPIQACQNELRGALELRNYADNWFTDSGIPNGILKSDQVLTGEIAQAYRDTWEANLANGRMQVVGHGLSYHPVYLNPADAQFLENQAFTQTQIARMFGVPAVYMMTDPGNSMTYNNQAQVDQAFVRYTLQKYFTEIEQAFTSLLPRGQKALFKTDGLLRADVNNRYEAYTTAIAAGFLTVDEVREREGLLPLNGNGPVVNTNEEGGNTNG